MNTVGGLRVGTRIGYNRWLCGLGIWNSLRRFARRGWRGIRDRAMRVVARRRGCPYAVTEALLDVIMLNGGAGAAEVDRHQRRGSSGRRADYRVGAGERWRARPAILARARVRRGRPELRVPGEEDQEQGARRAHVAGRAAGGGDPEGGARRGAGERADDGEPAAGVRRHAGVGGAVLRDHRDGVGVRVRGGPRARADGGAEVRRAGAGGRSSRS